MKEKLLRMVRLPKEMVHDVMLDVVTNSLSFTLEMKRSDMLSREHWNKVRFASFERGYSYSK
jgi:hypothetical protein